MEGAEAEKRITNEHLYYCTILNQGNIIIDKYELIFNGTISEQKRILSILEQNMKKHERSPSAQAEESLSHL